MPLKSLVSSAVLGIKVSRGGGREELISFQKGSTSRRR
jgi:hypothetical protein